MSATEPTRHPLKGTPCECCGDPATRWSSDGVPLCAGDFDHYAEHEALERDAWRPGT